MYKVGSLQEYTNNKYYLTPTGSPLKDDNNPRMYIFRTASTSTSYTIGYPKMEGEYVNPEEPTNENMLSPAFILASQLGQVTTKSWDAARKHCHDYVEVYDPTFNHNPKTIIFKDWRLPTHAEIRQMVEAQTKYPEVMDKVLTGNLYWNSMTQKVSSSSSSSSSSSNDYHYVRCVHNLTPEVMELLEELNAL